MNNNKQEIQEGAPVEGSCRKCKKIYNKRTGAYDNQYGMICIECYKPSESHEGVEEIVLIDGSIYDMRRLAEKVNEIIRHLNTKKHE